MTTSLKLTERELAIARGEDPDKVIPEAKEEVVEEVVEEVAEEEEEEEAEEPAEEEEDVEEEVEEEVDWRTDEVKAAAESLGIGDELNSFKDADEFLRAKKLLEKQAPKSEEPKEVPKEEPEEEVGLFDPESLKEAGYDDDIVNVGKELRKSQEESAELKKEIAEMRQWREQMAKEREQELAHQEAMVFHDIVNGLEDERFGTSSEPNHEAREKLWDAVSTISQGLMAKGKQEDLSWDSLIDQARRMAFPDPPKKKQRAEAVKKQSAKRRSVGAKATKTTPVEVDPSDAASIANSPELTKWWNENVTS